MEKVSVEESGPDQAKAKLDYVVITPSGRYPAKGTEKINTDKPIADALKHAAQALKLTNTSDWLVFVAPDRELNPTLSFEAQGLSGTVELEWHKREGGGGASARC
jgi:hypothetical protein